MPPASPPKRIGRPRNATGTVKLVVRLDASEVAELERAKVAEGWENETLGQWIRAKARAAARKILGGKP